MDGNNCPRSRDRRGHMRVNARQRSGSADGGYLRECLSWGIPVVRWPADQCLHHGGRSRPGALWGGGRRRRPEFWQARVGQLNIGNPYVQFGVSHGGGCLVTAGYPPRGRNFVQGVQTGRRGCSRFLRAWEYARSQHPAMLLHERARYSDSDLTQGGSNGQDRNRNGMEDHPKTSSGVLPTRILLYRWYR
jgi:hypothetical protein